MIRDLGIQVMMCVPCIQLAFSLDLSKILFYSQVRHSKIFRL